MIKLNLFSNKEVKNAGWLIGGKIAQMILSLFVGILTARYLGPGNYGLINYASAYVAFFTAFCTLGINSIIVKELLDNPDDQGEIIGTTIVLRIVSSALSAAMIVALVSIVDKDEPTTIVVAALCSIALVFQVFNTINYWFQSQYCSKVTAIATLVAYVGTSAYKIVLLILQKDVVWFAFATAVDYIVDGAFLFIAYKRHGGQKFKFSKVRAKALLKKSYHYILSGLMVAIYGQTDKLMLKHMLGETEVGYYATATALCGMWVFVLQAIIDSVYPTITNLHAQNDKEGYERKNRQLYAIVFYVSCFVSLVFTFGGKLIIGILYGEEYLPAAIPLAVVTWYTAFSYLGVARNAWIVCEEKQKYLKYLCFVSACTNVILNLIFIPWLGTTGAALATLITEACVSILLPLAIKPLRQNAKLMLEAVALRKIK